MCFKFKNYFSFISLSIIIINSLSLINGFIQEIDFKYIIQYSTSSFDGFEKSTFLFKEYKYLISFAKENSIKIIYGTNAPYSISNLIIEQIAKKEGMQFTHILFFKATPEYQRELLGEHINFTIGDFRHSLIEASQNKLILYLIEKRSEAYFNMPILKDLKYEISIPIMLNVIVLRNLLDEIINLEEAFTKGVREPTSIKVKNFQSTLNL